MNKALFKWRSALYARLAPTWVLTKCSVSVWLSVKLVSVLSCSRAAFVRELETAPPAAVDGGPHVLLSSQFWPMWSKSRKGLGQMPIGRTTLSG